MAAKSEEMLTLREIANQEQLLNIRLKILVYALIKFQNICTNIEHLLRIAANHISEQQVIMKTLQANPILTPTLKHPLQMGLSETVKFFPHKQS